MAILNQPNRLQKTPVVAVVSSDPAVVYHLQVTELESRDNETTNELTDLPEPDKSDDEETDESSDNGCKKGKPIGL